MSDHLLIVFSEPAEGRVEEYTEFFGSTHLGEMVSSAGVSSAQLFEVVNPEGGAGLPTRFAAVYRIDGDIEAAQQAIQADRESRTPISEAVNGPRSYWFTAITDERS